MLSVSKFLPYDLTLLPPLECFFFTFELPVHPCRPPPTFVLLPAGGDQQLLSLEEVILENQSALLNSFSLLQDGVTWDSSKQVQLFAFLMSRVVKLLSSLRILSSMVATSAPGIHIPNKISFVKIRSCRASPLFTSSVTCIRNVCIIIITRNSVILFLHYGPLCQCTLETSWIAFVRLYPAIAALQLCEFDLPFNQRFQKSGFIYQRIQR